MIQSKSPALLLAIEILDLDDEVKYLRAENARLSAEVTAYRQAEYDQYMSSQVQLYNWMCKIMDGSLIMREPS